MGQKARVNHRSRKVKIQVLPTEPSERIATFFNRCHGVNHNIVRLQPHAGGHGLGSAMLTLAFSSA